MPDLVLIKKMCYLYGVKTPGRCVRKQVSVPYLHPCPLVDAQPGWPACVPHLRVVPAGPQRGGGHGCKSAEERALVQGLSLFRVTEPVMCQELFVASPGQRKYLTLFFYCVDPDKFIKIYVLNSLLVIWKNSRHKRKTGDFIPFPVTVAP